MTRVGFVNWLRRRDPGYRVLRRGARLSLVAAAGLFGGRYGLDDPLLGLYTLFGAIATGFISQLPGSPVQQARALLMALPAAWVLVAVGSFLAVDTWTAVAGMLLVGFVVPFAGVAGPRALGLATGLQLFYIAASFPPYAPGTLPSRLAGVTLGIALLIVAELVLWPDRAPPGYRERLAGVAAVLGRYLELAAELPAGGSVDHAELARRRADATRALEGIWLPNLPPAGRPASAAARDRALRHGDMLLRQVLDQTNRVCGVIGGLQDDELARLLRQVADIVRDAGRTLRGGAAPIGLEQLAGLETRIRETYERPTAAPAGEDGSAIPRLRLDAVVLHVADTTVAFGIAARLAVGLPPPGRSPKVLDRDEFWYARRSPFALYWWQFRYHLTTRSVYLQGAVRVALALGAARVIAGFLNLNHGFWVLLAILTLMRTSAVDTRTALRPVLLGTLLGAAVGSLLLTAARTPQVLLVALPVFIVLTFTVSPLLAPIWGQSLFTVLFILVFAQAGPASLQLAGARLLDVAIGATVGVLAGLLLWPKGGSGELRLAMARYLEVSAAAAQEATRLLTGRESRQDALTEARQASVLADASFFQYQMERHDPKLPPVNWQAALTAGNRLYLGAESRLHRGARARLPRVADAAGPLDEYTGRLRQRYGDLARQLRAGRLDQRAAPPPPPDDFPDRLRAALDGGESRAAALNLVDVEVWLTSAGDSLDLIQPARRTD
ncbi:FUSC family protein [Plantactinospora soyae]|uniref:Membrane protein YccC n=1 Tax=Plantactinospora soyae TaxID=1544732 RepID=A0A927M5L2_9ACTN|nr:FUSC family protein [Plantactinospora soyae]MBE1485873.1 putative membrane protein YccC [Plantactinospora soyae]